MIETGLSSTGGSIIAYFLLRLWKNITRKVKVRGLLINNGFDWDKIEEYSSEDIMFINVKKQLQENFKDITNKNDLRLKVYPIVKKYVSNLKDNFKRKTIVLLTDDIELLKYLNVRIKFMNLILPSEQLIAELNKVNNNIDYNKLKLDCYNVVDKKHIHILDNAEQIITKIREIYDICLK